MRSRIKFRKPASPCYARLRFGITQQQLADILGVSRSLITMMEQGKRELPRGPGDIYLQLCRKADELPFAAIIHVKRGRKPMGSDANLFSVPAVSNYRMSNLDTGSTTKSWVKQRRWMYLDNKALPSPEGLTGEAKKDPDHLAFADKLKEQKNQLLHVYKFLEFTIERRGQRHTELTAKLEGLNKTIVAMQALEENLPEGRSKRKIKTLNAFNNWKQVQLSGELKKSDVIELLKTEWQMNCIKRQVDLRDEWIGALVNTLDRSGDIQYCISTELAA